jgi:hypothetical protein
MRPQALLPALDAYVGEVPERAWLRATAEVGAAHRRLPRLLRVERASSGRARCRQCREPIEKGALRLALQMFEDENLAPNPIGFVHSSCAGAYFGTADVLDRAVRLTPELPSEDREPLREQLARSTVQPVPPLAKTRPPEEDPGPSSAQSA